MRPHSFICAALAAALAASPTFAQSCPQKVSASNTGFGAHFGGSLGLEGNQAILGAHLRNSAAGAAYVFARSGGTWSEVTSLTSPNGATGHFHQFGYDVDISGAFAVVSAPFEDANGGAVYVFENIGGTWSLAQRLQPADNAAGDEFGITIALDGPNLAVGASRDDDQGADAGAVYVYRYDGATWQLEQQVYASDAMVNGRFGYSVGIEGELLAVGAAFKTVTHQNQGGAYVFRRQPAGTWSEEGAFVAPMPDDRDFMGVSVDVSGGHVVAGAEGDDDQGDFAGAAYVFEDLGGGAWGLQTKLVSARGAALDSFGNAVTIDQDTIIASARLSSIGSTHGGAAFVFRLVGGNWMEDRAITAPDTSPYQGFSEDVKVDGTVALIGADLDEELVPRGGAAYFLDAGAPDCNGNGISDACDILLGSSRDLNGNGTPDECEALGSTYCVPARVNSTGEYAHLFVEGSDVVADNDVTLYVGFMPQNSFGYFLLSQTRVITPFPAGSQGVLCLGGSVGRFNLFVQNSGAGGAIQLAIDLTQVPTPNGLVAVQAGSTWNFQAWYRDANPQVTSNFSSAVTVSFQ